MLHTNLDLLDDKIKQKAKDALAEMNADEELKKLGVTSVIANETLRELSTQMAYYSRKLYSALTKNHPELETAWVKSVCATYAKAMYQAANLWNISDFEAIKPNTWTLNSKHLHGLAIDLVPMRGKQVWWSAPEQVWDRIGEIGEKHGLSWGGRWNVKDLSHFEI